MAQIAAPANPFMLLMYPDAVLAAVAKSERLGELRRHLCRPLDRPTFGAGPDDATDGEEAAAEAINDDC